MDPAKHTHTHRGGADPKVAMRSAGQGERTFPDPTSEAAGGARSDSAGAGRVRTGRRIERAIRRLIKPLYLPLRRFFTGDLLREIREGHSRLSGEITAMAESLRRESAGLADRLDCLGRIELMVAEIRGRQEMMRRQIARTEANVAALAGAMPRTPPGGTGRFCVPCGGRSLLIRTNVGYVICESTDHALVACLLERGELEPGVRRLIERVLSPGSVFVDIGANIGIHTLAAARAICGEGRVFAFEPFGPVRAFLERALWINGLADVVTVREAAVSDREGRRRLFLGATCGHHSLFQLGVDESSPASSVAVETVTLDAALAGDQRVDLIKIDAEGAELDVLAGARAVIGRNFDIALIVEFCPSHIKRSGHDPSEWLDKVSAHGFAGRLIDPDTGVLGEILPEVMVAESSVNLFFAREGSPAWERAGQ